jgi:protein tyrosine/serine phosphatase
MKPTLRATLILGVILVAIGLPLLSLRMSYVHGKRLREVVPGQIWRSGQMTAEGFEDAVRTLGLRTIINLQDEDYGVDPDLTRTFWDIRTIKESELCRRLGVRFVTIKPDLVSRKAVADKRPQAIDQLLALLDDRSNYPVLLHCKAGLHRTGVMSAIVRMEYQGWSRERAYAEMKAHGFGDWACTSSNDYVKQYVLTYTPGLRFPTETPHAAAP